MPSFYIRPGGENRWLRWRLWFNCELEVFREVGIRSGELERCIDLPRSQGWPGPPRCAEDRFDAVAVDIRTRDRDECVLGRQEPEKTADQRLLERLHQVVAAQQIFRWVIGKRLGGEDCRAGGGGLLVVAEAKVREAGVFAIAPRRNAFAADQVDPRVGEVDDLRHMGLAGVCQHYLDLEGGVLHVHDVVRRVQCIDPASSAQLVMQAPRTLVPDKHREVIRRLGTVVRIQRRDRESEPKGSRVPYGLPCVARWQCPLAVERRVGGSWTELEIDDGAELFGDERLKIVEVLGS